MATKETSSADKAAKRRARRSDVIDRIVEQNNALWELLTSSDNKSPEEKLALLKRAFPGAN
jgi:hypothetical protein